MLSGTVVPVRAPESGQADELYKVLDLLGDLMLLGAPLRAHLSVEKGGHGLHHELVKALLATPGLLERCDQTVAA